MKLYTALIILESAILLTWLSWPSPILRLLGVGMLSAWGVR